VGVGALLLSVAGMIFPAFFWWACGLFVLSFFAWSVDVWLERTLPVIYKILLQVAIIGVVALFYKNIVAFPADPQIKSFWAKSDYKSGENIDGIIWHPGLSELRVLITNPTDRDFDALDLWIRTNEGVFKISQTTSIPCERLTENLPIVHDSMSNVWKKGPEIGPIRFRCDKLPKHSTMNFILALANIDDLLKLGKAKAGDTLSGNISDGLFSLFGPKRKPSWVDVTAVYTVTFRPRSGGIHITDIGNM
jgi:hypothetical protein